MDVPGNCCRPQCCNDGVNDIVNGVGCIVNGIGKGICSGFGVLESAGNALGSALCDALTPKPCCRRPSPHPPTCTCNRPNQCSQNRCCR